MIDLETRIVDCIEQVDADDVEPLDLERIVIEGLRSTSNVMVAMSIAYRSGSRCCAGVRRSAAQALSG